jgi:tetratricopeptide (TPR) repeat protein
LRIKAVVILPCGLLLIVLCGFAAWRSIHVAVADWAASAGTIDGFERALHIVPDDPRLQARTVMFRIDTGDPSSAVDAGLQHATRENPFDSDLLMTMGLREEFRGNRAAAERYLVRAAEVDHQFKPAWTLANYYYRIGRLDESWPMIRRILNLEPFGFDLRPVFELCWSEATENQNTDSRKILSLIPARGHKPIQYLAFLSARHGADVALEAWPKALTAADPADLSDRAVLNGFVEFLSDGGRIPEAVSVWNQLVGRGMIRSGILNPAKGMSVADADFAFAAPPTQAEGKAFDWRLAEVPGVLTSRVAGALQLEMSGDEPQSFQVLSTFAPVMSRTAYRLRWKSDGSLLRPPQDPGFSFQIVQPPGEVITQCPPVLSPDPTSCDFVTLPGTRRLRIDLRYARAPGTTRVSGILQLMAAHLELAR